MVSVVILKKDKDSSIIPPHLRSRLKYFSKLYSPAVNLVPRSQGSNFKNVKKSCHTFKIVDFLEQLFSDPGTWKQIKNEFISKCISTNNNLKYFSLFKLRNQGEYPKIAWDHEIMFANEIIKNNEIKNDFNFLATTDLFKSTLIGSIVQLKIGAVYRFLTKTQQLQQEQEIQHGSPFLAPYVLIPNPNKIQFSIGDKTTSRIKPTLMMSPSSSSVEQFDKISKTETIKKMANIAAENIDLNPVLLTSKTVLTLLAALVTIKNAEITFENPTDSRSVELDFGPAIVSPAGRDPTPDDIAGICIRLNKWFDLNNNRPGQQTQTIKTELITKIEESLTGQLFDLKFPNYYHNLGIKSYTDLINAYRFEHLELNENKLYNILNTNLAASETEIKSNILTNTTINSQSFTDITSKIRFNQTWHVPANCKSIKVDFKAGVFQYVGGPTNHEYFFVLKFKWKQAGVYDESTRITENATRYQTNFSVNIPYTTQATEMKLINQNNLTPSTVTFNDDDNNSQVEASGPGISTTSTTNNINNKNLGFQVPANWSFLKKFSDTDCEIGQDYYFFALVKTNPPPLTPETSLASFELFLQNTIEKTIILNFEFILK